MRKHASAVVCEWCNRTISVSPGDEPVALTICDSCADWTFTHSQLEMNGSLQPNVDYYDFPPRGDQAIKH